MTWIWLVLVVVVLGASTAVAAGRGDRMRPAYPDRPDVRVPASGMLRAQDLAETRFSVVPRGYRMDEVDDLISRLTREIAVRDAELARMAEDDADAASSARRQRSRGGDTGGERSPGEDSPGGGSPGADPGDRGPGGMSSGAESRGREPERSGPERNEDVGAFRHPGEHPGRGDRNEEGPNRTGG